MSSIKDAVADALSFLWDVSKSLIQPTVYAISNKTEVRKLSLKVHEVNIRSSYQAPQESSNKKVLEAVLEAVTQSMINLSSVLEDQVEIKKKDKEEKKNNRGNC